MTFFSSSCSRKGISSILIQEIIQKNNTREHCLSTIQPSEAIAQPPLEGPARGDPARESGARAPVAGAMSHSPPGGPAVASPSGAAAARFPSSESPDAYGDACPVLTCQALDSLVAKCQARAAVTAQRGCKFPQKEQSRPKLTPPVVAGLEDLAEMLGASRTEARNQNGVGRSSTIGDQVHPHCSYSAHRGRSISGASRQARARALCVHMSWCTWCTNLSLSALHSD